LEHSIIISGFGGQGILFLGKILTLAGMNEGKEVTWFPSYGAEMRGGTANCTVIFSDELIGSPVVSNPDTLIVMNDSAFSKFYSKLKKGGLLLYDSSLINGHEERQDIEIIGIPATEIASRLNAIQTSNIVLAGAFIAKTGMLKESSVLDVLSETVPAKKAKLISTNKKALLNGIKYIENKKS
jgi:2-oxoglutarate ferredoxin oxidoreductase subunit gamma